ncbi:hypothetical protein BJF78_24650 [Pseudonocardia sp. CNS-139]|nr:hypothetical protein BJF78_24650 [Pseudonocardia sp. CNS-139]
MTDGLPEHLKPVAADMSVPVDDTGRWIDNGHWRDTAGVTHWHLFDGREWSLADPDRFNTERERVERVRSSAGVARSPHEVVEWLAATREQVIAQYEVPEELLRQKGILTAEDRRLLEATEFRMAMLGRDVFSSVPIRGGRTVYFSARAMTGRDCSAPHE